MLAHREQGTVQAKRHKLSQDRAPENHEQTDSGHMSASAPVPSKLNPRAGANAMAAAAGPVNQQQPPNVQPSESAGEEDSMEEDEEEESESGSQQVIIDLKYC